MRKFWRWLRSWEMVDFPSFVPIFAKKKTVPPYSIKASGSTQENIPWKLHAAFKTALERDEWWEQFRQDNPQFDVEHFEIRGEHSEIRSGLPSGG